MFPKSSVFPVVALAAFVSLGALLLPQVVQAQECLFDCPDLGSDPSFNPLGLILHRLLTSLIVLTGTAYLI